MRADGRMKDEMRDFTIEGDYTRYADGSVYVQTGATKLICTAMVEDGVPRHCRGQNMGWLTAEYAMLPSANPDRNSLQTPPSGRTKEIQRLIGRSLRMAVDLGQISNKTIWVDCDVIQADGGTRTAAISAAFVAVVDALWKLRENDVIETLPITHGISAISVGVVDGIPMLDLTAEEDKGAAVDMNVVRTHSGQYIEIQGTAEAQPFGDDRLQELLEMAAKGTEEIKSVQLNMVKGKLAV
ncbi:MAG: ribonuclease PH [Candidatus Brocadiia bacterium]